MSCSVLGCIDFDPLVQEADEMHRTVLEQFKDSKAAQKYQKLAQALIAQGENRG